MREFSYAHRGRGKCGTGKCGTKMRGWKMQDRKMRDWKCGTGNRRTGKCRTLNTNVSSARVTVTSSKPHVHAGWAAINIKDFTEKVKLAITRSQNVSCRDIISDTYEKNSERSWLCVRARQPTLPPF